jgi:hypothetical protein
MVRAPESIDIIFIANRNRWKTSLYSFSLSGWPIISFFFSFGVAVVALLPTSRLWLLSRARLVTFDNNILSSIIRSFRWRRNERGRGE